MNNEKLLNLITPTVLNFNSNFINIGENKCECYVILTYPSSLEYGWLGKISNVKGTVMVSHFITKSQAILIEDISKNITNDKIKAISEKDNLARLRAERRIEDG